MDPIERAYLEWKAKADAAATRKACFNTLSMEPVDVCYGPKNAGGATAGYLEKIGFPGDFPFTRGTHPTQYLARLRTRRQFACFCSARDTNQRYKYLLERGQTGLSVAFDMPTLMGYDSDHPRSEGEVGKCGVAIASLQDMETLFDGIPLDRVSTSMTINGPAAMLFCFYVAAAEQQGISPDT